MNQRQAEGVHDGGPAFPIPSGEGPYIPGMSLRQWYAGLAMQGFAASNDNPTCDPDKEIEPQLREYAALTAAAAFRWADAMLAAGSAPKPAQAEPVNRRLLDAAKAVVQGYQRLELTGGNHLVRVDFDKAIKRLTELAAEADAGGGQAGAESPPSDLPKDPARLLTAVREWAAAWWSPQADVPGRSFRLGGASARLLDVLADVDPGANPIPGDAPAKNSPDPKAPAPASADRGWEIVQAADDGCWAIVSPKFWWSPAASCWLVRTATDGNGREKYGNFDTRADALAATQSPNFKPPPDAIPVALNAASVERTEGSR